jgi:ATP-dependent DNA helicase RecG
LIANPGGFPEGITQANILVHEPKPRNPRLAEVFNRIGLIEQSGRGVDRIYEGQLRYGRPAPDYSRTDASGVRVVLRGGQPSLAFAAFVYEQDKKGTPLALDELMVLNALFLERRIDSETAGRLIQKGTAEGRSILERLLERGLAEAKGEKRGRVYTMSASLYKRLGGVDGYVRSRGFTLVQQRQMVLNAIEAADGGRITREKVAELCQIGGDQAYRLLRKLREDGDLDAHGKGRGAFYTRKRAR